MSDGASITGSPTIDQAIHWMSGSTMASLTNEARSRLDFAAAETPAPHEALLLRQHAAEANNTIAELEATVQRALLETEAKDQQISALQSTAAPPQHDQLPAAAMAALTTQVAMLTDMVSSMQAQYKADKQNNQGSTAQNQGTKAHPKPARANPKAPKPPSCESSYSSDEDEDDHTTGQDETGPAVVTIFARSFRYKVTDPDRISDRKDIDGVDSDYKRISEKRPHLIRDAQSTAGKRGTEIGDLARALHSRLSDSLEPQPSPQCAVGLSLFALHDNADSPLQRKIQNALIAVRGCKTASDIKEISQQCRKSRRIPATLITGAASFSDSAFTMAIKLEATKGDCRLVRAFWNLLVQIISLDRCPAMTLNNIDAEWTSIDCKDVEDALQEEFNIHKRAEKLLSHHEGNKSFSTFDDRVENILLTRGKLNKTIREKFYTRLDLDNLTLIELSWDDVWERVVNADLAASRNSNQQPKIKTPKAPAEDNGSPSKKQPCTLHGDCGHTTAECRDITKLGADPVVIKKLKSRRLCVFDYYGKCG